MLAARPCRVHERADKPAYLVGAAEVPLPRPDLGEQAAAQLVGHTVGDRLGIGGDRRPGVADHCWGGARRQLIGPGEAGDLRQLALPLPGVEAARRAGERQPGIVLDRAPLQLRPAGPDHGVRPLARQVGEGAVEIAVDDQAHPRPPGGERAAAGHVRAEPA
jgi:hypothetical protein